MTGGRWHSVLFSFHPTQGYGVAINASARSSSALLPMVRRFNHQSLMILNSATAQSSEEASGGADR